MSHRPFKFHGSTLSPQKKSPIGDRIIKSSQLDVSASSDIRTHGQEPAVWSTVGCCGIIGACCSDATGQHGCGVHWHLAWRYSGWQASDVLLRVRRLWHRACQDWHGDVQQHHFHFFLASTDARKATSHVRCLRLCAQKWNSVSHYSRSDTEVKARGKSRKRQLEDGLFSFDDQNK